MQVPLYRLKLERVMHNFIIDIIFARLRKFLVATMIICTWDRGSIFSIRTPHGYSPLISLITRSSRSSLTFFFSSHSQIISTFQPMSISFLWFCLSRSTFRFIFGIQYSVLEEGQTNLPQSCLCQKQPFTKITA